MIVKLLTSLCRKIPPVHLTRYTLFITIPYHDIHYTLLLSWHHFLFTCIAHSDFGIF